MLDALLRLDLRVDPRSRGRRLRSSVRSLCLFGLGSGGAVCAFARNRAARARATRVRLPARRRPRARTRATVEARAWWAGGLGSVEARARAGAVGHDCGAASCVGAQQDGVGVQRCRARLRVQTSKAEPSGAKNNDPCPAPERTSALQDKAHQISGASASVTRSSPPTDSLPSSPLPAAQLQSLR